MRGLRLAELRVDVRQDAAEHRSVGIVVDASFDDRLDLVEATLLPAQRVGMNARREFGVARLLFASGSECLREQPVGVLGMRRAQRQRWAASGELPDR